MPENKKRVDGIEVYDFDRLTHEPIFFTGYKQQISTARTMVSHSLRQQMAFTTMIFGPPGTGKTIFPAYVAQLFARAPDTANIKFVRVVVPRLAIRRTEIPEIEDILTSEILTVEENGAFIASWDEVEALQARRSHHLLSLIYAVADSIDTTYELAKERKIGANTFISTNSPDQIDEAILSRVNYTIYFPPPDLEKIKEILAHFGVPEPERVAEALTIRLEGRPISGRGLVSACESIQRLEIKYGRDIWDNADLLMANAVLVQKAGSIKEYEIRNEYFIEKSERTKEFWQTRSLSR